MTKKNIFLYENNQNKNQCIKKEIVNMIEREKNLASV